MGGNVSVTLNLLCLDPERKVMCYNKYFINEHVFHIKEYDQGRKTYNSVVCVKGSTSNEFEVNYYRKLEEVIELKYHNEQNRVFLFKYYWFDTTNRGIRVDLHHDLAKNNTNARFYNVDYVFIFSKQC